MEATQIISQLIQVLDQAKFDGIKTQGMNEVLGVRQNAVMFLEANQPVTEDEDGDDVSAAAE